MLNIHLPHDPATHFLAVTQEKRKHVFTQRPVYTFTAGSSLIIRT